jgi:hypothetical protein
MIGLLSNVKKYSFTLSARSEKYFAIYFQISSYFYIHLIFHVSLPGKYAVMANFHLCFAVIVRTFFSGDEIYVHLKQDTPMYYRNSTSLSFYNPFTGILDGVTPYPQCTIGALFRMHSTGESPDLIVPDDWQLTLQLFPLNKAQLQKEGWPWQDQRKKKNWSAATSSRSD